LKTELVKQGRSYAAEALGYRDRIADLSLGFIKDDSVVSVSFRDDDMVLMKRLPDSHTLILESRHENASACS
jgi:translation initiation factor eIF-2B subunit alpha